MSADRLTISRESIERHYAVISKIGNLGPRPEDGYLRAAWSDEETAAMKYVEQAALQAGLSSRWDALGNLCVETPGETAEWVECGSHLDTVPQGGNFDGTAGVIAGLQSLIQIAASGAARKKGLRLRVWRCEESATFNSLYAGSLGAFGQSKPSCLENRFRGITLAEAMRSQGADPECIMQGKRTISAAELDCIAAHIELHIEQGNLLENEHIDIGVVTGIRGPYRSRIVLRGEFDHSGATPMGVDYRRDANLALAYILVELDKLAAHHIGRGADLVQTVGIINSQKDWNESHPEVYQNAVTKVSGYACFTLDARSDDGVFLAAYREEADALIRQTAAKFRVEAEQSLIGFEPGIKVLDLHVAEVIESVCRELDLSCKRMPSGAGHDAAIVGKQKKSNGSKVPVGMIFIPCRRGKSHSPDEYASSAAIAKGASVLAVTLARLAAA